MSPHRTRLLLLGGTGQVGWELRRTLAPLGRMLAPSRAELDLARAATDPDALLGAVRAAAPLVVVNAAAYTAVDQAEAEPALAHAVNARAPALLARACAETGALLVHFSTDYVFDGTADRPYRETDPTAPVNVYGASKRAGEEAIVAAGGAHLIFRTSWIYGLRGRNFLRTMRRLAREQAELHVVSDQRGAPTWSRLVAEGTALVLARVLAGRGTSGFSTADVPSGIYHLSAAGEASWHEFAEALLASDPRRAEHLCRRVVPLATADRPTPARRPRYTVLDDTLTATTFGVRLPDWREQLALVDETE